MELHQLFAVVRRRWVLVVIPAFVVAAVAIATYDAPAANYSTGMRFTAGQRAAPAAPSEMPQSGPAGYDPNYARWQTSEYIVSGLRDWVRSAAFAALVSAELASQDVAIPTDALLGRFAADSSQSLLVVYVNWPDSDQLRDIASAAATVLQTQNHAAFPQLGGQPAEVTPMDAPGILPVIELAAPTLRTRLDLPFRLALGVTAGLALAFVVDYLDASVRHRGELEAMGIQVVGEIPRMRGKQANR